MRHDEDAERWFHRHEELVRHPAMAHCCAVQTLRALHALTCEPCSDRVRRPYRRHQRFHRQHRGRDLRLGLHPDERIHPELRLERRLVRHLGAQNLHLPDVVHPRNHQGEVLHQHPARRQGDLGHLGDRRHLQDGGRLGDPFPVMGQKDCCQGG